MTSVSAESPPDREVEMGISDEYAKQMINKCCNCFFFVMLDGAVRFYDKKHLFSYAGEERYFTAGDRRVVVEYKGFRFLLQVCYDIRFPV